MIPKPKTFRDPKFIASFKVPGAHYCLITGAEMPDGAHIRIGSGAGMGMKPADDLIIPLAHHLHLEQHTMGEREFWEQRAHQLISRVPFGGVEDVIEYAQETARRYYKKWKAAQ